MTDVYNQEIIRKGNKLQEKRESNNIHQYHMQNKNTKNLNLWYCNKGFKLSCTSATRDSVKNNLLYLSLKDKNTIFFELQYVTKNIISKNTIKLYSVSNSYSFDWYTVYSCNIIHKGSFT